MRTKSILSIQLIILTLSLGIISCNNREERVNSIEYIFEKLTPRPDKPGTFVTEEGGRQNDVANLSRQRFEEDISIDLEIDNNYEQTSRIPTGGKIMYVCRGRICPCQSISDDNLFYFITPSISNSDNDFNADRDSSLDGLFTGLSLNEVPLVRDTISINGKSYDRYTMDMSPYENTPLNARLKIHYKLPISGSEGTKECILKYDKDNGVHHGMEIAISPN